MYRVRNLFNCGLKSYGGFLRLSRCTFCSNKKTTEEVISDSPIKFSTSKASSYKARTTRTGENVPRLWYEPHVIIVSMTVFMIYFCILREENDIDAELSTSLYSRIEGLEELQLKQSLAYNVQRGLDTKEIVQRLKEIEEEKSVSTHSS